MLSWAFSPPQHRHRQFPDLLAVDISEWVVRATDVPDAPFGSSSFIFPHVRCRRYIAVRARPKASSGGRARAKRQGLRRFDPRWYA